MKNKKTDTFFHSVTFEILRGVVLAAVILFSGLALGALALGTSENPSGLIPLVSVGIFALSGMLTGIVTRSKRGLVGRLPAPLFVLILLLIGLISSGGHLSVEVLIGDALYIVAALLGGLIGKGEKKKKKRK